MGNQVTYSGTVGTVIFDFDNRRVSFQRKGMAVTTMHLEDIDISFDEITEIEFKDRLLDGGLFALVVNGYRLVSDAGIDETAFYFKRSDRSGYLETVQRLARACGINELKAHDRKEIPKKQYVSQEHRMKCNVCGKVYCYTEADLRRNRANASVAKWSSVASVANALGGTAYNMYEQRKQADAALDKIVDYTRCPYCKSTSISEITEQEFQAATAAPNATVSSADELKKYKELLDGGIITQEEFDAKKKQLLGL